MAEPMNPMVQYETSNEGNKNEWSNSNSLDSFTKRQQTSSTNYLNYILEEALYDH
jgi:hypothetical protein